MKSSFFLQREMYFFPIVCCSEATINNKHTAFGFKIRTFQKGRENRLEEGLGWKQVCVFFLVVFFFSP